MSIQQEHGKRIAASLATDVAIISDAARLFRNNSQLLGGLFCLRCRTHINHNQRVKGKHGGFTSPAKLRSTATHFIINSFFWFATLFFCWLQPKLFLTETFSNCGPFGMSHEHYCLINDDRTQTNLKRLSSNFQVNGIPRPCCRQLPCNDERQCWAKPVRGFDCLWL